MREENLYTPDCIRTFSGIYVNVFEPTEEMINIVDIAHSLAHQCRFGGHLPQFFSVAQHSLNCSHIVDNPNLKLEALMHDAGEAYLLDIPRPIKKRLSNYKEIEDNLMCVISRKFGFNYPFSKEVKEADEKMLELEWYSLMLRNESWNFDIKTIEESRNDFLSMFRYYTSLLHEPQKPLI